MKVALIARSSLYSAPGGDTIQVISMAKHLETFGIAASIQLTHEPICYDDYDLLHFFNITRPADIIYHIQRSPKPYVASPNLVRFCEYDQNHRTGFTGMVFRKLKPDCIEYFKAIARHLNGSDKIKSISYLWKGQRKSIRTILKNASMVLPNSGMENTMLRGLYGVSPHFSIIPNGIDPKLFAYDRAAKKDENLVLCIARIEGLKNQLNLIKALNRTRFTLLIIGSYAVNQQAYYQSCKNSAASNIVFLNHLSQAELVPYYQKAKVHILPSWFETCGLSTLEAAVMGCNVIVTNKGYTREFFGDHALYCDPASPSSILGAVQKASVQGHDEALRSKILDNYTWQLAAARTAQAYQKTMQAKWD
jgi:glycosyltransferase involved in cell wall biosynthesis